MKRIISILLCISIVTFTLISGVISASAASYDETAYTLTGNQRADIVGIALTQVGYQESGNNVQKYGPTDSWCTYFVKWCAEKAGIPNSIFLNFGSCDDGISRYKSAGLWRDASYTPNAGDLIFFVWGHVGIVNYVDSNGGIHIIDGNFSDKVNDRTITAGGGYWYAKSSIIGFATPDYTNSGDISNVPVVPDAPAPESVDEYYEVVTETYPLNLRSGYSINSNIVGSIPKGAIFHVSQVITSGGYTWGMTDFSGFDAWCALEYAKLLPEYGKADISFENKSYYFTPGESVSVSAVTTAEVAESLTWESSDESVAVVSDGTVTATGAGSAVITVKSEKFGASASFPVVVISAQAGSGDANSDGVLSVADVVAVSMLIMNKNFLSDSAISIIDVTGEGVIGVNDVVMLRRIIVSQF